MAVTKEIIKQFINGDDSAFNEIYEEYRKLAFFIICSYVSNEEDAKEILNTVFVKVSENRMMINSSLGIKSFISSIAKNEAINYVKKMKNITYLPSLDDIYDDQSNSNDILNSLESLLTNKETIIVYLKVVFDYTWKEINEETLIPISSARAIYKKAIEKLRKELR